MFHLKNNENFNLEIAEKIFEEQIFEYCNFTWTVDDWDGLISIIEDKIINMQEEKKKLINDVLDDGYNSANILKSLSSEELKSLFI